MATAGDRAVMMPAETDTRARKVADARSPREQVVGDVIRGLYDGRYRPGQRLKEIDFTERLGISRGPVREAFNRLEAIGIATLTLQRGAQVRHLSRAEAIGILVVVEALVGVAARCAAERIAAPGAADRLRHALERLIAFDPASPELDHAMARDGFYATLTDISDNSEIKRILPGVQIHLIRTQFRTEMEPTNTSRRSDYQRIASAVLAGNARAAESAARAHIAKAIDALRDAGQAQG